MGQLIWTIYGIIILYFILGGVGFYLINRKKPLAIARNSYVKFFTYFLIINMLFFSIVLWPWLFRIISLVMIGIGSMEIYRLFIRAGRPFVEYFILSEIVFIGFAGGFYLYCNLEMKLVLFGFLIISIFDAFSQISGQLWGHKKILPRISPNKTLGGVVGGAVIAYISGFLLRGLYDAPMKEWLIMTTGIVMFAFLGDVLASMYKRKYQVKDYSRLIPGHGGVLDRFDSLIAGGAWVAIYFYMF